ncbi:MAG: electron transfer flavoprotein-ubiquinone oxidoreductase [Anaerohalosphaeraceae bacterium]|nr:electron transfer flavoprotein-ubiquinone oxidoreductase [Anaerohalosphaeraceae bacterium]
MNQSDYKKTSVLIVGAGPAGLSAAITLKCKNPNAKICVIDKSHEPGNHNLSGAVIESEVLAQLLRPVDKNWALDPLAKDVLVGKVKRDNIMFFLGKKFSFNIFFVMALAKKFGICFGQMLHGDDYIVSVSKLTKWFAGIAEKLGVEIVTGFAVEDIIYDSQKDIAIGVKLVDQGLDKDGRPQPNYVKGEVISADAIVLAEGCDGLVTERFIEKAALVREMPQLYSLGVKELIKVSDAQYEKFTSGRVVHAMGYPLWTPVLGPAMFGGGIMYPMGKNQIAVGMIVGLDWKYCDFNPQDALTNFKNHSFVKKFIAGGTIVQAGAKMIPEGGYYSMPRDARTSAIGSGNVMLLGDSAGLVNMMKIKGLHNAIKSGIAAGTAIAENTQSSVALASKYTELLNRLGVINEMRSARKFRQAVAKLGPLFGMPLASLGQKTPKFTPEEDYKELSSKKYKYKPAKNYDKDTFTAMAATTHREEQPSHLKIINRNTCAQKCTPKFNSPCITFCPAGVYETVAGQVSPANPSNCLHCKTCQRKCPFDNIRWTVPEGSGGPRYQNM